MKYCSHCGKEICDEAVVCPNCGCAAEGPHRGGPNHGGPEGPRPDEPFRGFGFPKFRPLDIMAVIGFILSFFMPIAGLVISTIAYNRDKYAEDYNSLGYAKAGIIISIISLALILVITVLTLAIIFSVGVRVIY
jgi:hypothetical protein